MRISKRVREQSTLLCALAATGSTSLADVHIGLYPCSGGMWSDYADAVWRLSNKARIAASERLRGECPDEDRYRLSCIEAAVALAKGWSP